MFLAATPAQLGLPVGDTTFRYSIVTCPGAQPLCEFANGFSLDSAPVGSRPLPPGPYFWNYAPAGQGLNFGGREPRPGHERRLDQRDLEHGQHGRPTNRWERSSCTTTTGTGTAAQVVLLDTAQSADLAISGSAVPGSPLLGQNVTLTVTVTNGGPNARDRRGGERPASRRLDLGLGRLGRRLQPVAPGAGPWRASPTPPSASVNIVATVEQTGQQCVPFQITEGHTPRPESLEQRGGRVHQRPALGGRGAHHEHEQPDRPRREHRHLQPADHESGRGPGVRHHGERGLRRLADPRPHRRHSFPGDLHLGHRVLEGVEPRSRSLRHPGSPLHGPEHPRPPHQPGERGFEHRRRIVRQQRRDRHRDRGVAAAAAPARRWPAPSTPGASSSTR